MPNQAPAWLVKYISAGTEGFFEPISVAILSSISVAFINALNSSNLTSTSSGIIFEYMLGVFLITLTVNFVKGLLIPLEAGVNALGMIIGIFYFGSAVSGIAPDAVYEVFAYILAAIVGISFGIWLHSKGS